MEGDRGSPLDRSPVTGDLPAAGRCYLVAGLRPGGPASLRVNFDTRSFTIVEVGPDGVSEVATVPWAAVGASARVVVTLDEDWEP